MVTVTGKQKALCQWEVIFPKHASICIFLHILYVLYILHVLYVLYILYIYIVYIILSYIVCIYFLRDIWCYFTQHPSLEGRCL